MLSLPDFECNGEPVAWSRCPAKIRHTVLISIGFVHRTTRSPLDSLAKSACGRLSGCPLGGGETGDRNRRIAV